MNTLSTNLKSLSVLLMATMLAYSLATGKILNYVTFTDPLGEMAVFIIAVGTMIYSLTTFKK
tara:strand:- start:2956 stop:3141 length:186 start_codon:yes stop_codon:yes gene_type:complete